MPNLSVLVIHNRYRQPGGEDAVVRAEVDLLRDHGHRVIEYLRDNAEIECYTPAAKASLVFRTAWNRRTYSDLRSLIHRQRPDIAHCHNFLPLVSPAAYDACSSTGVPVVQTLHNYRLFCPAGTLFSAGRRCHKCIRSLRHAALRGCYRNSRLQSAAVCLMLSAHRLLGTWKESIDAYLTPSTFCHNYFVSAGLPAKKLHLKPNFLAHDPGPRNSPGDYALFAGRLSPEKGVLEMIAAWKHLPHIPLLIAGDGPLYPEACRQAAASAGRIELLGHLDSAQLLARIKGARFVVFPSRWDEPFGMGLLEAAACGVPAIASRAGGIPELVIDGHTGLLFDHDDFSTLVDRAQWAWSHPAEVEAMGLAARQFYQQKFTAETNYETLMNIYRSLLRN